MKKSLIRKNLIIIGLLIIGLIFFSVQSIDTAVGGSEQCPLRKISVYDLEMKVPPPGPGSTLSFEEWWGLFLVSKGIRDRLFDEDPDNNSLDFSDLQLAGHLTVDDAKDYPQGPPTNPAPPGSLYDSDYIIAGSVYQTNPIQVNVSLQASVTREFVGDVTIMVDMKNPYDSGFQAVRSLYPFTEQIRGFQNKKRTENSAFAVYPNLDISPRKQRIKTQESTEVDIKMTDCDGRTYRGRSIKLSSTLGQFDPQEVTTDENGEAKATFTAGKTPGWAQLTTDYMWKYPCGHGPFDLCEGTAVAIEQQPADVWAVKATVTENVTRRAKKMQKLGEVTIPPDHPLIKSGTHTIREQNLLLSTQSSKATIQMVIKVDASSGDFVYSGEEPLVLMVSGNASKREKEEKIEYINQYVSEFSTKRQDTYNGTFDEGSFEFQYTPDYQYVSVSASSKGQVQTKHERFEDGRWRDDPYSLAQTLGIGAGWSTGVEGGSITRTKSGYTFSYRHTETERKETSDFGTITTVTTVTLNGVIKPFSRR